MHVDVRKTGAVCLGNYVVCDGFVDEYPFRVQTHIHEDHMNDFDTSKGQQSLYMSPETYDLILAERNADIGYRSNIYPIDRGTTQVLDDNGIRLSLIPSNHMLGACQTMVELPDGYRIGYSGDFGWPVDNIIEVDELVVDSTYGNPEKSIRRYTQEDAETKLAEIVCERLRHGSVHVQAHPGTIERVIQVLWGAVAQVPILASDKLLSQVKIHQKYGSVAAQPARLDSECGRQAIKERSYIQLYSRGDGFRNEQIEGTRISCSAYMVNGDDPMLMHSERSYSVALSNHADFEETIAYVKATGARKVVTDNTRSYGVNLAFAIRDRLPGVIAKPSSNKPVLR